MLTSGIYLLGYRAPYLPYIDSIGGSFLTLELPMPRQSTKDPRRNTSMAKYIDEALQLVNYEGMGQALTFMETVGVPRQVAVRVLGSPVYSRSKERRARMN